MNYYFAPMEGITGHIYRRVHGECFRSPDKYFTPFLVPGTKKIFRNREIQDILPENNPGLTVVPQILTGKREDFIRGARDLQRYGFQEINLNLGCPSGSWKLFWMKFFRLWILRSPSRRESVWKNLRSFQDFLRFSTVFRCRSSSCIRDSGKIFTRENRTLRPLHWQCGRAKIPSVTTGISFQKKW